MVVGAGYVFPLASHGGIRGWNVMAPGPLGSILRSELAGKEFLYTRIQNLKILTGTWNVAEGRATSDSLVSWIGSAARDVGIVVVGLQEVEMGAGVLSMSAVGLERSSVGQWWLDMIDKILDEGLLVSVLYIDAVVFDFRQMLTAWCDRILFRDNRSAQLECLNASLECPVVCLQQLYRKCNDVGGITMRPFQFEFPT
ncbi:unnamed protein product, partial [Linum tenue]